MSIHIFEISITDTISFFKKALFRMKVALTYNSDTKQLFTVKGGSRIMTLEKKLMIEKEKAWIVHTMPMTERTEELETSRLLIKIFEAIDYHLHGKTFPSSEIPFTCALVVWQSPAFWYDIYKLDEDGFICRPRGHWPPEVTEVPPIFTVCQTHRGWESPGAVPANFASQCITAIELEVNRNRQLKH